MFNAIRSGDLYKLQQISVFMHPENCMLKTVNINCIHSCECRCRLADIVRTITMHFISFHWKILISSRVSEEKYFSVLTIKKVNPIPILIDKTNVKCWKIKIITTKSTEEIIQLSMEYENNKFSRLNEYIRLRRSWEKISHLNDRSMDHIRAKPQSARICCHFNRY